MKTLAELATGDADFSILVAALTYLDDTIPGSTLVDTLADERQDLTVFAPNNAAFGQLAADLGFTGDVTEGDAVTTFLVANVPADTLNAVVLYHLADESLSSSEISAAKSVTTLQGGSIGAGELPTLTDNEPDLIDPTLLSTDIDATNGVLHIIDRVLLPVDLPGNDAPTIAGIVAASGGGFDNNGADFDMLLASVTAADLVGALGDTGADLTAFAPNDEAFIGLAKALGFAANDEGGALGYLVDALGLLSKGDAIGLLTTVLTYHVAPVSLQSGQVLASSEIATLQGGSITVDGTTLGDLDPDVTDPTIIATDIQASNGVVHVIDGVLLPADLLVSDGAGDVDLVIGDSGKDMIRTGKDTDYANGKGGMDLIRLGQGDDVGFGGDGKDMLWGKGGNDLLNGDAGRDFVRGGGGDDIVSGGAGFDNLRGGAGNDTFVIKIGSDRERIISFDQGEDTIDLSAFEIDGGFDALEISGGHSGALIDLEGGVIVRVVGIEPNSLTADDFSF